MEGTKIRWATDTWNPMSGCSEVSPGCDHCYARVIAEKFAGAAYPNGFAPTFKPKKLDEPKRLLRKNGPSIIFTNSMSDVFHKDFTDEQIDMVFDAMLEVPEHQYLMLTKRPQRMASYLNGGDPAPGQARRPGYLARRDLTRVPPFVWLGTSIESDRYTWRANYLRKIPVAVRFLSIEPMLDAVPSLNLDGIGWVIVGGESGPGFRPMDHAWATEVRDLAMAAGAAFYFKQSSAWRTELGQLLNGTERWEQYPVPIQWERKAMGWDLTGPPVVQSLDDLREVLAA